MHVSIMPHITYYPSNQAESERWAFLSRPDPTHEPNTENDGRSPAECRGFESCCTFIRRISAAFSRRKATTAAE